jgi:hypothetical protein
MQSPWGSVMLEQDTAEFGKNLIGNLCVAVVFCHVQIMTAIPLSFFRTAGIPKGSTLDSFWFFWWLLCRICRFHDGRAAPDRIPGASRKSALETSICSYVEKFGDEVVDPCLATMFYSRGDTYDFYNLYLWEHGFRIRCGKSHLSVEKSKWMQEIVCGCSVSVHHVNMLNRVSLLCNAVTLKMLICCSLFCSGQTVIGEH